MPDKPPAKAGGARRSEKRAEKRAANNSAKLSAKVPVGLLAEAEVVGACLAAGQGVGLLGDHDSDPCMSDEAPPLPPTIAAPAADRGAPRCAPGAAGGVAAGACAAAADADAVELVAGAEVRLKDLVAAPELNGKTGRLQEFHEDRGRWAVALEGREEEPPKLVRPSNLEALRRREPAALAPAAGPRPAAGRAAAAPGRCLAESGLSLRPLEPCGVEVLGFDARKRPSPDVMRELEQAMAQHGFVLFRGQGALTGVEQCVLSEMFGTGQLHSTHAVHVRAPNQHIFRLSNDPDEGFNEVGPEWHHDGASAQNVFGHVAYHVVRAPRHAGETVLAHTGDAYDALPEAVREDWERLASVNSNGGIVHPLVFTHPRSGRRSVFLHLGMTGAMLRCDGRVGAKAWEGIDALDEAQIKQIFELHNRNMDAIAYKHRWREGDIIVIDNLAVAHKEMASAFQLQGGLRVLHRTTVAGDWPLVPPPDFRIPPLLDTAGPSPFGSRRHVWESGYVGLRWGSWREKAFAH